MEKYLIRMRSPADLFPFLVRDLSEKLNITDAAIMYDDTFGMVNDDELKLIYNKYLNSDISHHFTDLLVDMPIRHMFHKISDDPDVIEKQLMNFKLRSIKNYFVLAR